MISAQELQQSLKHFTSHALCQVLYWDADYIQSIRQQTEIAPPNDLSQGIFPIYVKDLTY